MEKRTFGFWWLKNIGNPALCCIGAGFPDYFPMQQAYIIEYQRLFILKGTSRILTIEQSRKENVRCLHSMAFAHGLVPPFFSLFVKYPLPCTKY